MNKLAMQQLVRISRQRVKALPQLLNILLLALIAGCAVKPDINKVKTSHNLPPKWTVEGRIAFKTPEDKFSASLEWQQNGDNYQLRLSKLIGGTLLLLQNTDEFAELQFDGETYREANPQRLLWQVTGWTLPVDDFKYWVSGLLNPQSASPTAVKRDEFSRLKSFTSWDNWQVQYQNYKVFSDKAMPYNLTIKKDKVQLRLRVSDWEFED